MKYFNFLVETTDSNGEKKVSRRTESSTHLSGAIRKLYQNIEGVNLIGII